MIDFEKLLKSAKLPSLPHVAARLIRRLRESEPPARTVEMIVRADPAAAARVLKFANATYFGRKWPVASVDRAAPLVGTTVVRSLTLMMAIAPESLPGGPGGSAAAAYYEYWQRSIVQAVSAPLFGAALQRGSESDLYFAGLLLSIGRLALLSARPDECLDAADAARRTGTPLAVLERERFGIEPTELTARLLQEWNFPAVLVEAARRHRSRPDEWDDVQMAGPLAPLAAAAAMADFWCDRGSPEGWRRLKGLFESCYRGSDRGLDEIVEQTRREVQSLEAQFPREAGESLSILDLYSAANSELAELVVSESIATAQAQVRADAARQHLQQVERRIEELERQALRDPLTKIYNRQFFEEALSREAARCCRHSLPIGLLFIDVDRFKPVNDTWGHAFGDRVLKRVARTIQNTIRTNDVLARFGGEEFVVLPGHPTEPGLVRLAERIRSAIEAQRYSCQGQPVPITASIGYTLALPTRHETDLPARLIAAADAAMYEAKHLGRNRASFQSLMDEKDRHFMRRLVDWCFSRWLIRRGVLSGAAVNNLLLEYQSERVPIGRLAVREGMLNDAEVSRIVCEQQREQGRFGTVAMRLGLLTEDQLLRLMALQREDPLQIARIAIGHGLFDDARAVSLVADYMAELRDNEPDDAGDEA